MLVHLYALDTFCVTTLCILTLKMLFRIEADNFLLLYLFYFFFRKLGFTFHVNCIPSRQFT